MPFSQNLSSIRLAAASATALMLALSVPSSATENDVPSKTIEALKQSVVPIVCRAADASGKTIIADKPDTTTPLVFGTGFFVNDRGDFMTAQHVIDDAHEFSLVHQCEPAMYLPVDDWPNREFFGGQTFGIARCAQNEQFDVAVCSLVDNPFNDASVAKPKVAQLEFSQQPDGTAVAFSGFPLGNMIPITSKGFVATYRFKGDEPSELVLDKANWPGASGSPVYLPNGKVVGVILSRGVNDGSGLSYARALAVVRGFLAEHAVPGGGEAPAKLSSGAP